MRIEPLIPIHARCNAKDVVLVMHGKMMQDQLGGSPETNIGNMDKEEREENRRLW
ncbi:MAG: hypothetical protein OXC46_02700 [Thaumarchaeota archaeon]|nr:hypothetical protein [Nitrososphaerota archaeon]